jgi:TetR/AcrR family transcriptional regulator, mexJK operon transcriptional repressor
MKKTAGVEKRVASEEITATAIQTRLDEERVSELLDAATEVFIEHGFEGASTNEIARRANCSKRTLYVRFPTKEKLFIAVLERRMDFIFTQFATALPPEGPVERALKEYGSRLLQFALSEDQIALARVVSMESPRFPKLGERFYELGPGRGLTYVASYMAGQIKRGELIKEDPRMMAEHLISLITGGYVRWAVLGLRDNPSSKEKKQSLDGAVKMFMRAYSSRRQP